MVHVPAGPSKRLGNSQLFEHISAFAQHLEAQWRLERPDVAHAHFWMSGIACELAARSQSVPTVQTFHSLGVAERRFRRAQDPGLATRLKLESLVAKHATWVCATYTQEVVDLVRMGRPRTRISVIPCGVDPDMFSTEGPAAEAVGAHRIVSVGNPSPRAGFETMIEALPAIPNAEYVVVGGPHPAKLNCDLEVQRLRGLAANHGVAQRVKFTGLLRHDDLPAVLRSADVMVSTPRDESFGIAALEAMACGVPVVASAVGGMLDIVVDGVTGRLVTPQRPRECGDAVSGILRDSFLRRSLGLAGRDRVCARYSWKHIASDTLRIYQALATANSATPISNPH